MYQLYLIYRRWHVDCRHTQWKHNQNYTTQLLAKAFPRKRTHKHIYTITYRHSSSTHNHCLQLPRPECHANKWTILSLVREQWTCVHKLSLYECVCVLFFLKKECFDQEVSCVTVNCHIIGSVCGSVCHL